MPGGQVIQLQGTGDSWKDAIDIIEHAKQTGLRNQLLQLKLQQEARAAQMDSVKLQMMQQELQKEGVLLQEHKAEHPKTFDQQYRAGEADIAGKQASTEYQQEQTHSLQDQTNWAPVLREQQSQEFATKHEGDQLTNKWTRFEQDVKSSEILKNRMDKITTGQGIRDLGSSMFQQMNPELYQTNKKQVELYSEKMGVEGFQKLFALSLQQKQQAEHNQILREQLGSLDKYRDSIADQKRTATIISAAKSPEALEALSADPEFKDDPTLQSVAQILREKGYDADTKKAFLTAIAHVPTVIETDAMGMQTKKIDPTYIPNIMKMTEELLKKQEAGRTKLQQQGKPAQATTRSATSQPTGSGTSKENPIEIKTMDEVKQNPGKWLKTPQGTVFQAPENPGSLSSMKYGRTNYQIEASGKERETGKIAPTQASLAVRG